ncbi:sensor histidine kinase [Clostridium hydrogeniformans]|uniref:sensor histidine kinase n=1 Tax=Clostridium hydrogeniformans TaxID=349933 RepID=UPI000485B5C8|nr:Spo0B domain-containing protein [Clostridium hydrogeniformans]
MKRNKASVKKLLIASIIVNLILVITLAIIALYNLVSYGEESYHGFTYISGGIIFYIIISIVLINVYFTIKFLYSFIFRSGKSEGLIETIEDLSNLNKTLRGQRHDFVNHLQIIYNLMELEEHDEAKDYIEKVYEDVIRVNKALKTKSPAINALLQAKLIHGEKNHINVNLYVSTSLKELSVPDWQFCRVLSNIIDNAIYALNLKEDNRELTIEILEDIKNYKFLISNNGPKISEEQSRKIFNTGFTTKGEKGTGMGLSIVRDIVEEYNGEISFFSDEVITTFKGFFPKSTIG